MTWMPGGENPPRWRFSSPLDLCRRARLVAFDANLFLATAGAGDVVGVLHSHERVHVNPECFLETQGHIAGETGLGVWDTGEGWAGYTKNLRGFCRGRAVSFDDFGSQEAAERGLTRNVRRQLRVTCRLQTPLRLPLSWCAVHKRRTRSFAGSCMSYKKVSIERSLSSASGGNPLVSSSR